ncbi:MAG: hypothetical protein R6U98_32740, partial [Pirellulaceae bacterium]
MPVSVGGDPISGSVAIHGYRYTAWTRKARMDATGLPRGGSRSPLHWMDATGLPRGGSRSPLHWMDATGLPRGG